MKILAVDLSLTCTGYAFELRAGALEPPKPVNRGMERIDWIVREVIAMAKLVDLVVLEGYAFARPNQAHQLGELGGVVRYALWSKRIRYVEVPPSSLKKYATGKGNAAKDQVLAEAIRRLGYMGSSNDEADALWLRQMALDHYAEHGDPVPIQVPKSHREALEKVSWPKLNRAAAA